MLDALTRGLLLVGLIGTFVLGIVIRKQIWRPSRKSSISAMYPALVLFIVFEVDVLATAPLIDEMRVGVWLSRMGIAALIGQDLWQLRAIYTSDKAEQKKMMQSG